MTLSHKEVAAQFAIPDDWLTKKEFGKRWNRSRVFAAPTGFYDRHDRQQMVMVRTDISPNSDTAGHIVGVGGMAVTDDTQRPSTIGHNAGMAAFVKHRTGEDISIISVGNPGVANPAWRPKLGKDQTYGLTLTQAAELYHGEFNLVSLAIARAARYAMEVEGLMGANVVRVGPSLDGSNASAGIGYMLDHDIRLRHVALIDSVGLSKERGIKRMKQFFDIEEPEQYLAANHVFHRAMTETNSDWWRRAIKSPANFLYGLRGVSLGGAAVALLESADTMREHGVSFCAYAAGDGSFETVPGATRTVESLRARGVDARLRVIEGASHAMTMAAGLHGQAIVDYIHQ